jgi:hypothetical protein
MTADVSPTTRGDQLMSNSLITVRRGQVWRDGPGVYNTVLSIDGAPDDLDSHVWLSESTSGGARFRVSIQTLVTFFAYVGD